MKKITFLKSYGVSEDSLVEEKQTDATECMIGLEKNSRYTKQTKQPF